MKDTLTWRADLIRVRESGGIEVQAAAARLLGLAREASAFSNDVGVVSGQAVPSFPLPTVDRSVKGKWNNSGN